MMMASTPSLNASRRDLFTGNASAVQPGEGEAARERIGRLHPADIADLFELAGHDERPALAHALHGVLDADVFAEMNDHVREDLIDALEARLRPDVILFDMSPMLVGDDALAFLDQVDCALMVAAAEETTVAEIEKCGADLAKRTQVLGVVLNKCRYMEDEESRAYSE